MNKTRILNQIVASLSESLEVLAKAARASHAEATHESSKAENKYDTRGLEAAYLAGGQARQARELMESIKCYQALAPKPFGPDEAVDVGALVDVEVDGACSLCFIGPRNGGLEITVARKPITVITPQSPLGQTLMGKKAGQTWTTRIGGRTGQCTIRKLE